MHRGAWLATLVLGFAFAAPAARAGAQGAPGGEAPPDTDYAPAQVPLEPGKTPIPATGFMMPDVPDEWSRYTSYDGRAFSTRLSLVPIVDYTAFSQDSDSVAQVGDQDSQWDVRTFRIMTRGRLKFAHPVDYFISVEVKGQDHVQGDASKLGFTDWYFSTQVGRLGELRYGKVKEPYIYEIVGDSGNLQQLERVLSPAFSATRNIGVRLSNTAAGERMTWSVGWFNDWWTMDEAWDESGNQFTGRVTGLLSTSADGADYTHLGGSLRYSGANKGILRYRQRPESNIASYYVDTGDLAADHADAMSIEWLWGRGPFLLSGDWVTTWVDSAETGDPHLWGAYVVVSYVLTGEHRPYDRKLGYARRLLPESRGGAWEIIARYSHVDLDDRLVGGGTFDKGTLGLSWWATRRWRIGAEYGLTDLDRSGLDGLTRALHLRFQWIY